MIGIENKDKSFFTVQSPDVILDETDFSKDVISLSVTERLGSMPQGRLTFHDPNHIYSRILRTGARLNLAWGYRSFDFTKGVIDNNLDLDEISGDVVRRGLEGFVSSPAGKGDAKGLITYNCNFTSYGFRGLDRTFVYDSGTRANVIRQAFSDIGILPINMIIDFRLGNERLSEDRSVRQDETTYLFLSRLSNEWRSLFTIAFNQKGLPVGVFVDPEKIGSTEMLLKILGAKGTSHNLGYKGSINNVKSYSWKSNESESGVGQNIQIEIVDGQPVFRRFIAEQETIITYKLNTGRIKQAFKEKEVDGIVAQTKLVKELLSKKDFESIKHFFDPYETTTAPQGFGYKIRVEMIGNPLFATPNKVNLIDGFPDRLGNSQTIYYLNEVVHTIDRSGYNMSAEIVDAFTFSDLGVALF